MSDQCASIRVVIGSATVSNRSEVTTPNWPPPAPRSAQNRSGSRSWSQSTTLPSASTTRAPSEAVAGQPVPAAEQTDPAAKGEAGDADGGTAPGRQGPTVGVQRRVHLSQAGAGPDRGDPVVRPREMPSRPDRSSTIPSVEDRPAKQCPPLRAARRSPVAVRVR